MIIKLLIDAGEMKPGPAIAQQIGPMGINMGQVISKVNEATSSFKGMKVPVELDINEKTKEFEVSTSTPPTSELLKKELGIEKGSLDHKKLKAGNASIEDIIKVAKIKMPDMLQKEFKSAVKSILGTCASIGILVQSKEPNELIKDVDEGKFVKEINEKITETPDDKRKDLNNFYEDLKRTQEEVLAKEKAEAEEAEKEKEAAAADAGEEGEKPEEESEEKSVEKPEEEKK